MLANVLTTLPVVVLISAMFCTVVAFTEVNRVAALHDLADLLGGFVIAR